MLVMTVKSFGICAATLLVVIVANAGIVTAQSKAPATRDAVVSVSGMACQDMCAPTLHKRLAKLPDVNRDR